MLPLVCICTKLLTYKNLSQHNSRESDREKSRNRERDRDRDNRHQRDYKDRRLTGDRGRGKYDNFYHRRSHDNDRFSLFTFILYF